MKKKGRKSDQTYAIYLSPENHKHTSFSPPASREYKKTQGPAKVRPSFRFDLRQAAPGVFALPRAFLCARH